MKAHGREFGTLREYEDYLDAREAQTWLRWATRKDVAPVAAFDPGAGAALAEVFGRRDRVGMVLEVGGAVLGVMVYELHAKHLTLLALSVREDVRRQGIGRRLVEKFLYKLASHRREWAEVVVPEEAVAAQLLLRSCGFWAVASVEGGYRFERWNLPDDGE